MVNESRILFFLPYYFKNIVFVSNANLPVGDYYVGWRPSSNVAVLSMVVYITFKIFTFD